MMNKQEAIEIVESRAFNIGDIDLACGLSYTKHIINQIDEPQKPVVPKFVADFYESIKDDLNNAIYDAIIKSYRKVNGENDDFLDKFQSWLVYEDNSILILVQMQLFGYVVEKEKLYTVEIPDPNSVWKYTFLTNRGPGVSIDRTDGDFWKDDSKNQLTEAKIRKYFDFLWQFAKEVEE